MQSSHRYSGPFGNLGRRQFGIVEQRRRDGLHVAHQLEPRPVQTGGRAWGGSQLDHRVDQKSLKHGYLGVSNAALWFENCFHEGGHTRTDSGVTRKYPIKGDLLAIRKSLSEPQRNMEAVGFASTFMDRIFDGFRGFDKSHLPWLQAKFSIIADERQTTLFYELKGIIRLT